MLLSRSEIEDEIHAGRISIDPFLPDLLRNASYTLRLSDKWAVWKTIADPIDPWTPDAANSHLADVCTMESITLKQHAFILASSLETISLSPQIAAIVAPLSHVARYGVNTTNGSLIVSPGFGFSRPTQLTFELSSLNPSPVILRAGMPISHICFLRIGNFQERIKTSLYEGKLAPFAPLLFEDMAHLIPRLQKGNFTNPPILL